jgi:diguanylate cyclase (GGDEF)-like protein
LRRLRFPRHFDYPGASSDFFRLLAWLLGICLLIIMLWVATENAITHDDIEERTAAMRQAESYANSYAAQLDHVTEQIDRLILSLAYQWSETPERVNLARDRERGLFPSRFNFFASIIDASGRIVHTSGEPQQRVSFSETRFFQHHRKHCCDGLLITGPEYGPLVGKQVVRFSRRLDGPDGRFAGAVMIAVEPNFLVTFQDDATQGESDFVTARDATGKFIATRLGSGNSARQEFYLSKPVLPGLQGVRVEPGEKFLDGLSRFVAWRKLESHRLVAIAGLTVDKALASHRAAAYRYRVSAIIATCFLVLLLIAGIILSLRFAARRRAEEDVRRTYRMATDAANEGFYMLTPVFDEHGQMWDFRIEDCNDRAAALLGLLRIHLAGKYASEAMPDNSRIELVAICSKALATGIYEDELRVPSHGWIRATWVYRRAVHSGSGIALTLRDISDLKTHEQLLSDMANNDALTQLPNRRWLMNFLPAAIRRADRGRGTLALMFIDLDNFKEVNDTLGHTVGDELLVQAASRIRESVRASDHVVRLGGDEFMVLLENADSREAIARIADAIIARLSEPYTMTRAALVSASIGISVFPEDGTDADMLIQHADVAMYAAKTAGKSQHHFYDPALSDFLVHRLSKEHALRTAIERDEFVVYYQPRVTASTGEVCSIEALLRWQHPERGLVLPSDFIATAEEAGLIVPIGEIVIEKVGAQIAQWRDEGMTLVPVSVNVSPRQLQCGSTAACVARVLDKYRLPASLFEVEVTESAMVDRGQVTSSELDALRALGIRLMIDDFGTGYSSLAQLHRLDVDVLKVDQAFTHSLAQGSEGEQLYRAIISMAAALDMHVVAEGVETIEQLRLLQAIGCDEIQGHIIAPAVPPEHMPALTTEIFAAPFNLAGRIADQVAP